MLFDPPITAERAPIETEFVPIAFTPDPTTVLFTAALEFAPSAVAPFALAHAEDPSAVAF
jgi:hypothetical protein